MPGMTAQVLVHAISIHAFRQKVNRPFAGRRLLPGAGKTSSFSLGGPALFPKTEKVTKGGCFREKPGIFPPSLPCTFQKNMVLSL